MRASQRFWLSAMLLLPTLGSLPGCTQQQWWDDYVSKSETMKFLTFVSCDTFFVSALPEHQIYFHVTAISPNTDGSYRVDYQQQSKWVFYERLYIRSVSYIGLNNYTAIGGFQPASYDNARCAVLAVLPWSSVARRPFSYPTQPISRVEAEHHIYVWGFIDLIVFCALAFPCSLAMDGFLRNEAERKAICAGFLMAVVVLNAGVWVLNYLTLYNIDALASFVRFYDALPRSGSRLLPLQWSQAQMVFNGPPHPTSLTVDLGFAWKVLWISCAAWLVVYAGPICVGISYAKTAAQFDLMCARLAADGRTLTPEDYLNALTQAAATMSTPQLELLKRRMIERFPDGGQSI